MDQIVRFEEFLAQVVISVLPSVTMVLPVVFDDQPGSCQRLRASSTDRETAAPPSSV